MVVSRHIFLRLVFAHLNFSFFLVQLLSWISKRRAFVSRSVSEVLHSHLHLPVPERLTLLLAHL